MCKFRTLKAEEIDVRVASIISQKGFSLLLYKDARCDMNILDETVGSYNWQRTHSRDNANCTVSLWDKEKGQWISKEDTGVESNTEKEKGLASDSFKRACFNWGIGRELYTAPFIWVSDTSYISTNQKTQKLQVLERFTVSKIEYTKEKTISQIEIIDRKGNVVFSTIKKHQQPTPKTATIPSITPAQLQVLKGLKITTEKPLEQLTYAEAKAIIENAEKFKAKKVVKKVVAQEI